jgi:hypothetical protein
MTVGLAEQRLAQDRDAQALLARLDRSAQSGTSGTDDDDVLVVLFESAHPMNLRSEMVPEETSAMYASVRTTAARLVHASCM